MAAGCGDLDHEQIGAALAVEPIHYGPDWLLVDSCRVELPEVQRLLDDALAPAVSRVFPEVAGRQLVAYVVAGGAVRTPAEAHVRCVEALVGRPTAMAPRHYVLCEAAPRRIRMTVMAGGGWSARGPGGRPKVSLANGWPVSANFVKALDFWAWRFVA